MRRIIFCFSLVVIALLIISLPSFAEERALTVSLITVEGKPAEYAEVNLKRPGQELKLERLRKGGKIEVGAVVIGPSRTFVVLTSPAGNSITLDPGSRLEVVILSDRGESYFAWEGRLHFVVKKALDFFNVADPRIFIASVKGTEYSIEVLPNKEIRFVVDEGKVQVEREGKVRIEQEHKEASGIKVAEMIAAGKEKTYRISVDEYLKEFRNFKDAEDYYRKQLEEDEKSGDQERIMRGRNNLDTILEELGKYQDALGYFEQGLQLAKKKNEALSQNEWVKNISSPQRVSSYSPSFDGLIMVHKV
jgi:hypothetical protein